MLAPEKENKCCEHSGNRWVDGGMSDGEMSDDERSDCERSEGERSDCTHRGQKYFPHGHVFYNLLKNMSTTDMFLQVCKKHVRGGHVF